MFQWAEKFQPQQDWIAVLVILVFILSVYLYNRNTQRFKHLISFWKSKSYFNIYLKDKHTNPFQIFNLILTIISLIALSFLSYFFYEKILFSLFGSIPFISFFLVISAVVIFRYCLLHFIFKLSDQLEFFQNTAMRSLSFYAMISLHALFFFSIYYYRFFINTELLFIIYILVISSVLLSHFTIYLRIIRKKPGRVVYLILYLCAFKIAPWLWLFKSIY